MTKMADAGSGVSIEAFESIGHNCEFGFVAQALGSHESGLFRWAYVQTIDGPIAALQARFAGLFTNPDTLVPCFGVTMVEDKTFGIAFHMKIEVAVVDYQWVIKSPKQVFQA